MREVLFRGLRVDGKGWVEGFYKEMHRKSYIVDYNYSPFCFEIIPETVGQFTGLLDKNRKKIFEGDNILEDKTKGFIKFLGECFMIEWKEDIYSDLLGWEDFKRGQLRAFESFEIIGTIHDHLLTNKP